MHRLSMAGVCVLIGLGVSGCATLQANRTACRALSAGTGALIGGLGVGFAVSESGPSSSDRIAAVAGSAAGGAVAGAVAGLIVAHWLCPEAEAAVADPGVEAAPPPATTPTATDPPSLDPAPPPPPTAPAPEP